MKLTEKCKEDFENWYTTNYLKIDKNDYMKRGAFIKLFYEHPTSMQYGVYVDFFDSVGVYIESLIIKNIYGKVIAFRPIIHYPEVRVRDTKNYKSKKETRSAAIKKANELYNER